MIGQAADFGVGQPVRHVLQRQRVELQVARDVVLDDQGDVGPGVLGTLEGVDPHLVQRQHGGGAHGEREQQGEANQPFGLVDQQFQHVASMGLGILEGAEWVIDLVGIFFRV